MILFKITIQNFNKNNLLNLINIHIKTKYINKQNTIMNI